MNYIVVNSRWFIGYQKAGWWSCGANNVLMNGLPLPGRFFSCTELLASSKWAWAKAPDPCLSPGWHHEKEPRKSFFPQGPDKPQRPSHCSRGPVLHSHLNLSWPAVSQIWSLMRFPGSISTKREKKSTPTVGSETWAKRPSVKRRIRQDLPTVESPMTMSRNWYSQMASMAVAWQDSSARAWGGGRGRPTKALAPISPYLAQPWAHHWPGRLKQGRPRRWGSRGMDAVLAKVMKWQQHQHHALWLITKKPGYCNSSRRCDTISTTLFVRGAHTKTYRKLEYSLLNYIKYSLNLNISLH